MATPAQQVAQFTNSYNQCETYPENLLHKTAYRGVLKTYGERLETTDPPFLTQDPSEVDIHFRDWDSQNQAFVNSQFRDEDAIRTHFGESPYIDPMTGKKHWAMTPRRDPKCRFVFLYARFSTDPLNVTPRILKRLLSYHQVMPAIVDFLSVFANPPEQRELSFSGFLDQTTLGKYPAVASMGRSAQQYQLCYNLKRVARIDKEPVKVDYTKQKWSVQQSEFHHQFDAVDGNSLFLNAKGRLDDYRNKVLELTGGAPGKPEDLAFDTPENCFRSSLTVHLMNCHWAMEDWRGYLKYLEIAVEKLTRLIVVGPWLNKEFAPTTLQAVQRFEEKANNATMVLEANMEVLKALLEFYEKLEKNQGFTLSAKCPEAIPTFVQQVNNMIHAFAGQKRRATVLVGITENRKTLLLQKLQSIATRNMEDLTTMSYREAIVMKVIAAGTFVFLPATFVSTFFSTDVIKYQNTDGGHGSFSWEAMKIWIAVTLPLTLATFAVGVAAFCVADRRRRRRMPSSYDEKQKSA